jgi:hypothetical protein
LRVAEGSRMLRFGNDAVFVNTGMRNLREGMST